MKLNILFYLLIALPIVGFAQFSEEKLITICNICSESENQYADLDGDGDLDVIIWTFRTKELKWVENDGAGNFFKGHFITNNQNGNISYRIVDIDDNGTLDILFSRIDFTATDINAVDTYLNNGEGIFTKKETIFAFNTLTHIMEVADMDGDGDFDPIFYSNSDSIFYLINDGLGSFDSQVYIGSNQDFNLTIKAFDLQGIGAADIFVSSNIGLTRYQNDGTGNLFDPIDFSINKGQLIDFDNDGDIDLVSSTSSMIFWQENDGNNNFLVQHEIVTYSNQRVVFAIKDMDKDGDIDIAFLTRGNSESSFDLQWAKNEDNLNFTVSDVLAADILFRANDIFIEDLNQDGALDMAIGYPFGLNNDDKFDWFENDLVGSYINHQISDKVNGANFLNTADLNGDGLLDVIVTSKFDGEISWIETLGNGTFSTPNLIAAQINAPNTVYAADLDNDGDQDIIYSSEQGEKFSWYENDGLGNFTVQIILAEVNQPISGIHFADFNQDGHLDIVTASKEGTGLKMYRNNGDATFSFQPNSQLIPNTEFVITADLDGDGQMDVVTANGESDGVNWYRNVGGQLEPPQRISADETSYHTTFIHAADLDNDGDMDVLANSYFDCQVNSFFWYENEGNGNFLPEKTIATAPCIPTSIATGDLDGDGDLDVVYTAIENGLVGYQLNEGGGIFAPHQLFRDFDSGISFIHPADIDNDGDLDVLTANSGLDKVAWFENYSNHPTISGFSYWDKNENGQFDTLESPIKNISIEITPNAVAAITDVHGNFQFYVNNGNYQLNTIPNPCWESTNDSASYAINIDNNVAINRDFGFKLVGSSIKSSVTLQSTPTRCINDTRFWLAVENEGCQPISGAVGVVVNENIKLIDLPIAPDEIRMDTLIWYHNELIAGENKLITFLTERPNVEALGDSIKLLAVSYIRNDQNLLVLSSTYDFASEIRCAYDPNDKLVYPKRSAAYTQDYILFDENLEYTIRFQNTGNDTAFNVTLRDTLDVNLDWATFKPVVASHPFETLLHNNGLVEFSFKDILLPDSTTNELLSHGFVTYKIASKNELPENTLIENTANIYFDFNPPIITNTTQNILVSEFPITTPTYEIEQRQLAKVYPNPFAQQLIFEMAEFNFNQLPIIQLFDAKGQLIQSKKMTSAIFKLPTSTLANGLYFYQLIKGDGTKIGSGKVVK